MLQLTRKSRNIVGESWFRSMASDSDGLRHILTAFSRSAQKI